MTSFTCTELLLSSVADEEKSPSEALEKTLGMHPPRMNKAKRTKLVRFMAILQSAIMSTNLAQGVLNLGSRK